MFAELLAQSRAAAEVGDLAEARRIAGQLEARTETEVAAAEAWSVELCDLVAVQFVDNLGALPVSADSSAVGRREDSGRRSGAESVAVFVRPAVAEPVTTIDVRPVYEPAAESPPVGADPGHIEDALRELVDLVGSPLTPAAEPEAPLARAPGASPPSGEMVAPGFRDEKFEQMLSGDPKGSAPRRVAGASGSVSAVRSASMASERQKAPPPARKGVFRPEVLVVLGGVGVLTLVLKPWQWVETKSTAPANLGESQFPDMNFRQPQAEPVTHEMVRAKLDEKPERGKEVVTRLLPASSDVTGSVAMPSAAPATGGRPGRSGRRHSGATPPSRQAVSSTEPPPGGGTTTASAQRRGSHFYESTTDETAAGSKPKGTPPVPPAGLPVNTRLRASLEIGIASTKHDAVVIARVLADLRTGDKLLVPKGALLRGRSSSDNERVYVRFTELLVGEDKFSLDGQAVEGDLPGLLAQKRQATLEEKQHASLAVGALGAAADVAAAVVTGVSGTVVQDVGTGAIQETQQAQKVQQSVVLIVPAKTQFEVVVVE